MREFFALAIVGLSTWAIVEILHHGKIFAGWRETFKRWSEAPADQVWRRRAGQLMSCAFCLSPWASALMSVLCTGWLMTGWSILLFVPLTFAGARVANWLNDLHRSRNRTPKDEEEWVVGSDGQGDEKEDEEEPWGYASKVPGGSDDMPRNCDDDK